MIVIEVLGGVVQDVFGVPHGTKYFVLDWDNLLPDSWAEGDTEIEWSKLDPGMQAYVQGNYPDEYRKIMERITNDRAPKGQP